MSEGTKADNLRLLSDAGLPVPPFYVIPAGSGELLRSESGKKKLIQNFEKWRSKNGVGRVAVRSSHAAEDSADKSFAGQFTTVLDVSGGTFLAALEEVFRAKAHKQYADASGAPNAIVQEYVPADTAGVIFGLNPATGAMEYVINAAAGIGTTVVEGHDAKQYVVDRLSRHVMGENNTLLSAAQLEGLCAMAASAERILGQPLDIEWAFFQDKLYLLQARPITSLKHLRVWDSSNLSESFPGIIMPLTFSIAKRSYQLAYKSQAHEAGLSWYEIEANHRILDSMLGIFNGRMYYNLYHWYRFISLFPGSRGNQQYLDDQISTQGASIRQSAPELPLSRRIKFWSKVLYRMVFFNRELRKFYRRYDQFEQDMAVLPAGGDAMTLLARYGHLEQTIVPRFGRTVDNDFFVMVFNGLIKRLLRRAGGDGQAILGAISGVASTEQATSLFDIAAALGKDAASVKLLEEGRFSDLERHVQGMPVEKLIKEYLERFGHRFAGDQKIEQPNPVLAPHGIYRLLKPYLKMDSAELSSRIASAQHQAGQIEEEASRQLPSWQRPIYRMLMRRLKHYLKIRERNRLLRGRTYGYMRELFPKLGYALVREHAIDAPEDIFFLQIEEIYQLAQGSLVVNDLTGRIRTRREAYDKFAGIPMPVRFVTTGLPSLEKVTAVHKEAEAKTTLKGLVSSPGQIEGRVVVLTEPRIPDEPFDILVAEHTDPGWTPLIALARGVVVEHGGMLSHAAIVTRELGIPSIIGVENATLLLRTGMRVRINPHTSSVEIL